MDLLEDWKEDYHSDDELPNFEFAGDDLGLGPDDGGAYSDDEDEDNQALFVKEQLSFEPTRTQGKLVSIDAAGDRIAMCTERLVILLDMNNETKMYIMPKKTNDDRIHKIFADDNGHHLIVTLQSKRNYYINLGQENRKPVKLEKLKNLMLESVVWPPSSTRNSTGRLLLGTENGLIYEYELSDGKEKVFAKLYDLKTEEYGSTIEQEQKDNKCWRICGLHVEKLAAPKDIISRQSVSKRASQVYEAQNEKLKGLGFLDDDSDSDNDDSRTHDNRPSSTSIRGSRKPTEIGHNDSVITTTSSNKSNQMLYIIAAIPSAFYEFVGGPTFDDVFKAYNKRGVFKQIITDGNLNYTKLEVYAPHGETPEAVGWLTEVGITMCNLVLGSQISPQKFVIGEILTDMKEEHMIKYGPTDDSVNDDWHGMENKIPISFAITQFHVLIIYPDCYLAINKLNKKCVHYDQFPTNKCGLVQDITVMSEVVFVICDSMIFQIRPLNESRDVWELYLSKNEFTNASQYANTNWQRQKVLRREAEYYFNSGQYRHAAIKYTELSDLYLQQQIKKRKRYGLDDGFIDPTKRSHNVAAMQEEDAALDVSFEEIALKFLNVGANDALRTFLEEKMKRINENDKTQRTILATWLTEMHLARINELSHDNYEEASAIDDFEEFLRNNSDPSKNNNSDNTNILSSCKDVVSVLIASHGRTEQLIEFAKIQKDWTWVVRYYVENSNYKNAITVLGSLNEPTKYEELYYLYAPVLMLKCPRETVDMLIKIKSLDPKKLIPALMRYDSVDTMISSITGHIPGHTSINDQSIISNHGRLGGINDGGLSGGMDFGFDVNDLTVQTSVPDDDEVKTNSRGKSLQQDDNITNDPLRFNNENNNNNNNNGGINNNINDISGRMRQQHTMSQEHTHQAIRYLDHCIEHRHEKSKDPAIHNYLISLYCKQNDEDALLSFITSQKQKPIYDVKYALRLCHQENKLRACVELYKIMKLFEEAVTLALKIKDNNYELAKSIATEFKEAEPAKKSEQKYLWLLIAKHVVETSDSENVDNVLRIIDESKNTLSIEDILPHLKDFTQIGPFKENIKKSLEKYSKDINKLQKEMIRYTKNADDIRQDTKSLAMRSAMITSNRKCDLSGQNVLGSQFLLFPCTHVFRLDALLERIQQYRSQNKLPLLDPRAPESELMDAASETCPLCGVMMIDEVTRPFIDESDRAESRSWEIGGEFHQMPNLVDFSTRLQSTPHQPTASTNPFDH